jgi:uncharacterized phage protein gp47/JayE
MPYQRPTLTSLRSDIAQDIAASLDGADPLLRFSNLNIMGTAQAGLASLHYGYLDWISLQSNPFTATDEYLEGWAGLIGVIRIGATSASGFVTFSGTAGAIIPAGTALVSGDGTAFTTTAAAAVGAGGTVVVAATANADTTGLTGAFGNVAAGVVMTIAQVIAGIQSTGAVSTAFTGGADIEKDDSLRSRMLYEFQNPPQGGAQSDYIEWAKDVPGVTRAWCARNGYGAGTVVVYSMLDVVRAANGGFPQGANGVAADEPRATAATGDQLLVANSIYDVQPVTALVYSVAPTKNPVPFTIKGIPVAAQAAIAPAIAGVFLLSGTPGGSVPVALIWSAIAAVSGVSDFVITSPAVDIASPAGALPTVGTITFT